MDAVSTVPKCAILFATPTTREEFDCAAQPGSESDYMIGMLRGMDPVAVWASDYERVAGAARRLLTTAKTLKAGVYEKATLSDFADASRRYQYIVLFAHWRGAMFRESDLIGELQAFFDQLERNTWMRSIKPNGRDRNDLVDAFNEAITDLTLLDMLPEPIAQMGRRSRALGETLCRDLLDESFAGLTLPGNRVELFDGLHTLDQMEGALWNRFSGEIDMALCNSEALATFIDLRRNNTVQHLHWPDLLHPLPEFLKVETTLRIMAEHGGSYIDTRLHVEEAE